MTNKPRTHILPQAPLSLIGVLSAALLLAIMPVARPVVASGEAFRGELSNWNSWSMSLNLGGTWLHTTGALSNDSDSESEFKFFQDTDQWYSSGTAITFGQIFSGLNTSTVANNTMNHVQGRYYAFKWNGWDRGVIFQLSGAPAEVDTVSQVPAHPTDAQAVTVSATTDVTPPAEQALWLRYTTDSWVSSTVVKMTGSGTAYSAIIPAQSNGTLVEYYVLTSGDVDSIAGGDADLMTITYNTNGGSNYRYRMGNPITDAQALWVGARTVAWNGTAGSSYRLLYDPDGAVDPAVAGATACSASPAAPCYVSLAANGTIGSNQFPKNPNANGLIRLDLPPAGTLSDSTLKLLLQGQVVAASYDGGGGLVDLTRIQVQGVLDELYAGAARSEALGVTYSGGVPTVRVWAPTAKSVTLRRYDNSTTGSFTPHAMALDSASGVWSVTGATGWDRQYYFLEVEVYVPAADVVVTNLVTDPYSTSVSKDGAALGDVRSQLVNLDDADLKPAGWDTLARPAISAPEDMAVYEMHVRDFSINDSSVVPATDRGTFRAFTHTTSDGMGHLLALQEAGLTHVHLLPAFDIASVIEEPTERTEPVIPAAARDSDDQQEAVAAARGTDGFNWGYDPYHYGLPEGSYATNADGVTRILEFREMVSTLHSSGLRVALDVVYNHTADSGQGDHSVLDKVVPGYYYRYTTNGSLYNSSCCSDTASEYEMMEKLMIDTVVRWATAYQVDAFRFDLMNLHTRQNMLDIQDAVQAVDPSIYIYGEGWDFGSAVDKGLTTCPDCYARQYNMTGTGIGTFNDRLRDAAHGGYSTDQVNIRKQGFINGLSYDWNGYDYNDRWQSNLWAAMSDLRTALAGSGGFYTDDPQETINYVEKHDNETLFDQNVFKLPAGDSPGLPGWSGSGIPFTSMSDRVRVQNMGTSLAGLAQGIPFIQMGQDVLRSKSLDRNSYDSGDWFNKVDWTYSSNNFGVGLPPAWDNSTRWTIMSPLLANTDLDPVTGDIEAAAAHLREVLRLRASSRLFRLPTETDANARISFYNAGTPPQNDALIVMKLLDEPAPDLDPNYETILVLFNAHKQAQSLAIAEAAGLSFSLHPVHTDALDADPGVQAASFDSGSGTFTIPARTTAVFVSAQVLPGPSTLDWVGLMWPRGGVAHAINQGQAGGGFDVYVQVYEPGVTDSPGQGTGIDCYLHWGQYGQPWSDLAMTYNLDQGNNDEYRATISQDALNSLGAGNYGLTAYCRRGSELGRKWKQDSYDINTVPSDDDQGDGLITIIPASDPRPAPEGGVFVHLFEWRWADIEKECTYLAQKGYSAVQVSPPQEHLVPTADQAGQAASDYPWWVRYQPVSHDTAHLTSRSGTLAEFQSMVATCGDLGVGVYVDAVINHMSNIEVGSPPQGTAGTEYEVSDGSRFYGTQYTDGDFSPDCTINDYSDRNQVQHCGLNNLPDLDTGAAYVQGQIRAYLQSLLDMGVAGLRIDGAKHMPAHDIHAILGGLTGSFYVFQEVIDVNQNERVREWEYTPAGDVAEFGYAITLGNTFNHCNGGKLADLAALATDPTMLDDEFAVVFTDNHDNQRGHGPGGGCIVDHRDGQVHVLANIWTLAYPYGYPKVMSSYYWSDNPTSNEGDSKGPPSTTSPFISGSGPETRPVYGAEQVAGDVPQNCAATFEDGKWVCEHRRTAVANMVTFRQVTAGEPVTHWWDDGQDHVAFGRGDKGFVAINRGASAAVTTYQTGLPPGRYCDVVHFDFAPASGACTNPLTGTPAGPGDLIVVNSSGQIVNRTLASMDALAIHSGTLVPTAVTVASFMAAPHPSGILLVWNTVSEIDVMGFYIYRRTGAGEVERVTPALIPAGQPGTPAGGRYMWLDEDVERDITYTYWLESADTQDRRARYGPVEITARFQSIYLPLVFKAAEA